MERLPVYVLAGGRSSRFGRDKATAVLAGETLLARVAALAAPFAERITVVAEHAGKYEAVGLRTIADAVSGRGPLGGLLAALGDAEGEWTLVLPCDLVTMQAGWVARLLAARRPGSRAVVFRGQRWEPLPGLYHVAARPQVEAALAAHELTLWHLYSRVQTEAVPLPEDWPELAQVNSPADLRRAEAWLEARRTVPLPPSPQHNVALPEALALVLAHAPRLSPVSLPPLAASGLVVAEAVTTPRAYPLFARAQRDGFAVRRADAGRRVRVVGAVRAGTAWGGELVPGTCVEVMTGAPCPPGTDAVVPREEAILAGEDVVLPAEIAIGARVAAAGSDCPAGQVAAAPGDRVTPLLVACLANLGRERVRAIPRPRLGIVTTGDEIVAGGGALGPAGIRGSNGPMLASLAAGVGLEVAVCKHAADELEDIGRALAATADCDLVVTSGGGSAGSHDLVPGALQRAGAVMLFRGVRQRPGRSMLAARLGRRLVLGLPGTPLAAVATFWRYGLPAALAMSGVSEAASLLEGRLRGAVPRRPDAWSLALARVRGIAEGWVELEPCAARGGGDIFSPAPADALLEIAPGEGQLEPGCLVPFLPLSNPWPPLAPPPSRLSAVACLRYSVREGGA